MIGGAAPDVPLYIRAVINPINVMLTPTEVEFVANDCGGAIVIIEAKNPIDLTTTRTAPLGNSIQKSAKNNPCDNDSPFLGPDQGSRATR